MTASSRAEPVSTQLLAGNQELVDIKKVDPTILVELRYAGPKNSAQRALYPPHMPALVRPSVAGRLVKAQSYLKLNHLRLKIWDAYRPPVVQTQLWELCRNSSFVADPGDGRGSLHTWGVAVDVTIVDDKGKEALMPTDFDDFTAAAALSYQGADSQIALNLKVLQEAMKKGGFFGLRTEWWHFVAYDWKKYGPVHEIKLSAQ